MNLQFDFIYSAPDAIAEELFEESIICSSADGVEVAPEYNIFE